MKSISRSVLLSAILLTATPLMAFELSHSDGQLELSQAPQNIVSYDLGILDSLTTLQIPVAGVPKSTYTGLLAKYREAPIVGTLFEPDYDQLKEIQPDLIIASGRSRKAVPQLREVAPTVEFESDPTAFLATFKKTNEAIARAFDKEAETAAALARIQNNVDELHRINKGKTGAFLFTIKGNVIAHAPGDRFGYAYELTGLESVLPAKDRNEAMQPRPEPGSPEAEAAARKRAETISAVASADPDWLLVLDRGAINDGEKTAADTLAKHPELSKTRAYKEGRVYYADPNGWYVIGGGLTNMETITEGLLEAMK